MEKFIKVENKTGVVYDTKIIDLESGVELQNTIKSLTINPLIPGEIISGSMEIYVGALNIKNIRVLVNEASDNLSEVYRTKKESRWSILFQALAKGFLSL